MKVFVVLLLPLVILLGSCVEIIDDLTLHDDGSGIFKYNINLSASKVKVNSILALDSLDGKKMPSLDEIKEHVNRIIAEFKSKPGISQVTIEQNYTDFIFKFSCHFESINELQRIIKEVVRKEVPSIAIEELDTDWITFNGQELVRSIPPLNIDKTRNINAKDAELMKQGNYTSITRFDKEISRFDNTQATLSKNGMAVMIRCDPYTLSQNNTLLDNRIYLLKTEN